ncbi:hypothetical protein HDU79_009099 [Rhizoclosmatium sp. JEL0117]|nr:hypothetical protein HDU79_009099 [Rhizoclosmatium sp. JEL0117]
MASNVGSNITQGLEKGVSATMGVGEAFIAFINRGSVVDLAVGVVMGAAFTAIVTSFVNDLITPIIGLIGQKNLENLFLVIHCNATSVRGCSTGGNHPYGTIKVKSPVDASSDGAATWNYGNFLQAVINEAVLNLTQLQTNLFPNSSLNPTRISLIMFFIVQLYSNTFLKVAKKADPPKKTKDCVHCAEACPIKAVICKWCKAEFPVEVPKPDDEIKPDVPAGPAGVFGKMFHKSPSGNKLV